MPKNSLLFAGTYYDENQLRKIVKKNAKILPEELEAFLGEWFGPGNIALQTSGSTGTPKRISADRNRMRASARMTCSFLDLKAGDSAVLCMPLQYIGAKMMVVRALEYTLDLHYIKPSNHPLRSIAFSPALLAMTPAQVASSLETEQEATLLKGTKNLLIGGGPVDPKIEKQLESFPNAVWSTYGMTETFSHIALRRLSGPDASEWFTPFAGITLKLSPQDTLVISAPSIVTHDIRTNDVAKLLSDGRFRIMGRLDNVINTGGIKVQIETVEQKLKEFIPVPFQITAIPDAKYGELVVMLMLKGTEKYQAAILERCRAVLQIHTDPKKILYVDKMPERDSGKPDRVAARNMAKALAGIA